MKIVMILSFILTTFIPLQAAEMPKAIDIIQKEGRFLFTDGSSYYLFEKDGSFDSGPLSMCGREIHGKWTEAENNRFVIEGKWGWMNGISAINDKRRLIMVIWPPFISLPQSEDSRWIPIKPPFKIYKCYFIIEELYSLK